MSGRVCELIHNENYSMVLSDYGDGQLLESCFSCNTDITKTALIELSSQFGCQCDCSHCEYSYYFQGNADLDNLKSQLLALTESGLDYSKLNQADRVVVSFSRMGEPLLNPNTLDFIKNMHVLLDKLQDKIMIDIPTVMPAAGRDLLIKLQKLAASSGLRVRLRPTLFATDKGRRELISGVELISLEDFPELLKNWSVVPIIELQPVEIGLILSFELGRVLKDSRVRFRIRDMNETLPMSYLGHKMISQRPNYPNHIGHLKKGFERHGLKLVTEKREYEGISYPEKLDPGKCFSLQMTETLVRRLKKVKAVKTDD